MNDKHMFNAAKAASKNADYTGGNQTKVGCVIVYKGAILAKGYNSDKTHPWQDKYNCYRFTNTSNNYLPSKRHAEINAITKIKYLDINFSEVHLYIYRSLKNGHSAMARPCPACMNAIRNMGIKKIHYTTYDGTAFEQLY